MAAKKATKYVYHFGRKTDGNGKMKALLGGKGANLAEMTRIGLPVPPGCTITTEVCTYYTDHKKTYPKVLKAQMEEGITRMERQLGKKFGDRKNPLLLSVRSGARESMPGMMDTILNLGLNDETVEALARSSNNARFAWDSYRRFIQMYGDVVMGVQKLPSEDEEPFEILIEKIKKKHLGNAHAEDTELSTEDLQVLVAEFKKLVKSRTGKVFPNDPWDQLRGAVGAVFSSWMNDRAIVYRRKYNIPADWGTAVNVQSMVFGNSGDNSGSGVAFTRDPATGENVFWGEFMMNAQGEDVVAGVRTPDPVAKLKKVLPSAHKELLRICKVLEKHFRDVQDFEFTIEEEKVFMLQTRNGKRTGLAAVRIACEMVKERLISWKDAVKRIPADDLDQLLAPVFDRAAVKKASAIAKGLPAGPGAATGRVYFNADRAETAKGRGEEVLLVRLETSPEDLRGMIAANGILTARGGVSSHAALVARQMGKICVCGAADVQINYAKRTMKIGSLNFKEGDYLSIDGTSGEIFSGEVNTAPSEVVQGLLKNNAAAKRSRTYKNFTQIMAWCAKATKMQVRTNADTPGQVKNAIAFGATGIGLCRTEHMFFDAERIIAMREMILADDMEGRRTALAKLLPMQRQDFVELFDIMAGLPVTIRLLDPPLHEFLPHGEAEICDVAKAAGVKVEEVASRVALLRENNPMLGHRGCRLGISHPEIYEMQARAIFEAAIEVAKSDGGEAVALEIMIPLVMGGKELQILKDLVDGVAAKIADEHGNVPDYMVGTMIELPRAALKAGDIAEAARFFSFGTNDLTQTTLGISRDDAASFMNSYVRQGMFHQDPFTSLDQDGVGELIETACRRGRESRADLKLGICGEHGGDPASIHFFQKCGLDYVSCSPYRVPIARLAAAQAKLKQQ